MAAEAGLNSEDQLPIYPWQGSLGSSNILRTRRLRKKEHRKASEADSARRALVMWSKGSVGEITGLGTLTVMDTEKWGL